VTPAGFARTIAASHDRIIVSWGAHGSPTVGPHSLALVFAGCSPRKLGLAVAEGMAVARAERNGMVDDLVEAWGINHRVTLKVLRGLPAEALTATLSTRGGRDIARQFAHVHAVRCAWLRKADLPEGGVTTFEKGESPDGHRLQKALDESAAGVENLMRRVAAYKM
jgi:hypothetical protein